MSMLVLANRIYDALEEGVVPRGHANGFLTLDLSETEKIHIWPDEPIRKREDDAEIHDHAFSFRSRRLIGALLNTRFQLRELNDECYYAMYHVPSRAGRTHAVRGKPRRDPKLYSLYTTSKELIKHSYETYAMPSGAFHRSDAIGFTATHLTITEVVAGDARVLVPNGGDLLPFDRTLTPTELTYALNCFERVCSLIV